MTAKELINLLKNLDEDDEVQIGFVDNYGDEIQPVERYAITAGIGGIDGYALCCKRHDV